MHGPGRLRGPRLVAGDRLSRAEFERRYAAARGLPKAELIEGMVYVPSPVRVRHGAPSFDLIGWLFAYRAATPGVSGGDNTTVRLDAERNGVREYLVRAPTTRRSTGSRSTGAASAG